MRSFLFLAIANHLPVHHAMRCRRWLWRMAGLRMGRGAFCMGRVTVYGPNPEALEIGEDCVLNDRLTVDLNARVVLGPRVSIGIDCLLMTVDHDHADPGFRAGRPKPAPIHIGDGAWLGSRVTVLPGVKIGEGAVVGAGALVTRDLPAHHLCLGVPARPVRPLPTCDESEVGP